MPTLAAASSNVAPFLTRRSASLTTDFAILRTVAALPLLRALCGRGDHGEHPLALRVAFEVLDRGEAHAELSGGLDLAVPVVEIPDDLTPQIVVDLRASH